MRRPELMEVAATAAPPARRRPLRAVARAGHAWGALVLVRGVLAAAGLRGVERLLAVQRGVRPIPPDRRRAVIAETRTALDRALRGQVTHVACLQRAAACAVVLRRRGVPADVVIGVRAQPFAAHAWVEVDGRVVDDLAAGTGPYTVIRRV
ncbi:hypothetical protein tb265_15930 [Gemmatimonadetes bacterium T265]|nr:hypothetical protein tb265_15930 [Gemmatimonadetes bacterium T265]